MAHPHIDLTGSSWEAPPLYLVAFLPILSHVPLDLPSSLVEGRGTCVGYLFIARPHKFCTPLHKEPKFLLGVLHRDKPRPLTLSIPQTIHFFDV